MFDLIVKNASLPDGTRGVDLACKDGVIAAVEAGITAEAGEVIDAEGYLVSPPFVDPHFHMDATLSLGRPRMNVSGTLLEGIALWGELKPLQTVDEIVERALRYCDLAVAQGIGAIRSHVDTCDDALNGVQALLEVREKVQRTTLTCNWWRSLRTACCATGRRWRTPSARWIWAWMWWAAFRILNARWRMAPSRCACCAKWPKNAG